MDRQVKKGNQPMELVIASLLIPAGLFVFLCLGSLLPDKVHAVSLTDMLLAGFMLYFSAFQLIAFPMKYFGAPLALLTLCWVGIVCAAVICAAVFRRKKITASLAGAGRALADEKTLLVFVLLFAAFALFLGLNIDHISDYDAGYYIGLPASSLVSGTIERMNPNTGKMLAEPHSFYLLNTGTVHSAVVCRASGISPLVEEKFTFTIIISLIFDLFLYKAGRFLFPKKRRSFAAFFAAAAETVLFFSFSISGVSHYFAYRTYEGKSICSFLYMTAVFVFFLDVYRNEVSPWGWTGLALCSASACVFCNSAIILVPALTGALLLPTLLARRSARSFASAVLCLMPAAFWMGIYVLV